MEPENLTVRPLREIREELRSTCEELRSTREELGEELRSRRQGSSGYPAEGVRRLQTLDWRLIDIELRTATAIKDLALTELAGAVFSVRDLLADRLEPRDRVGRCEMTSRR